MLVANLSFSPAKNMNDLSLDDEPELFDNVNEEKELSEDIALLKINVYAIFFINLYIVSFIILIVYCIRCGEKEKEDERLLQNEWDTDYEANIVESFDPLIQRNISPRLAMESNESFDNQWNNYKNIYENT